MDPYSQRFISLEMRNDSRQSSTNNPSPLPRAAGPATPIIPAGHVQAIFALPKPGEVTLYPGGCGGHGVQVSYPSVPSYSPGTTYFVASYTMQHMQLDGPGGEVGLYGMWVGLPEARKHHVSTRPSLVQD